MKKTPANARVFVLLLAVWTGLEPATPCVTGMYSNQLNYQTVAPKAAAKIKSFFELMTYLYKKNEKRLYML
jgi:hypothetical protein